MSLVAAWLAHRGRPGVEALAIAPHDDAIRADYMKRLLEAGRLADARRVWEPLAPKALPAPT